MTNRDILQQRKFKMNLNLLSHLKKKHNGEYTESERQLELKKAHSFITIFNMVVLINFPISSISSHSIPGIIILYSFSQFGIDLILQ